MVVKMPYTSDRSISSVLGDIVQNIQDIVRAEIRLAKTEIGEQAQKAKVAGLVLGKGATCGFLAVPFAVLSFFSR
jgi:hypothetical protein